MSVREQVVFTFTTSKGKKRTVRVNDPSLSLTPMNATAAGEIIISANPFDDSVGGLVALESAERVTTTKTILV